MKAALNHARIMQAVEKALQADHEEFIFDFLKAYGCAASTLKRIRMGDTTRNLARVRGDIALSRELYFRAAPAGSSLAQHLDEIRQSPVFIQNKIRFVLVTDFDSALCYDLKVDDTFSGDFADLKSNYDFFLPLTGKYEKPVAYVEHPADVKACTKMGRLYDSIRSCNHYADDDLHTLNVFLTRLLFCFFAEDTEIFPEPNMMTAALESHTLKDGSDVQDFFETLFSVLDMSASDPNRKKLPAIFQKFPYVNGGVFKEKCDIPQFNAKTRRLLLDCGAMSWRDISPVIFGSMFQAVMAQDARRTLGAHYTSEENIFKVIRPLFLEALEAELDGILTNDSATKDKTRALEKFQTKLGSLGFLDPACGSGNFLIVAYRELRRLEHKAILAIRELEPQNERLLAVSSLIKVSIDQFHGIELLEFPVDIARISLHLMDHMLNLELGKACGMVPPTLPLTVQGDIVCANALTTDWNDVSGKEKINYIFGNPPFGGARFISKEQKADLLGVFAGANGAGDLDYVSAWFKKAADYIADTDGKVAFVATNSICQGIHVGLLWKLLYDMDIHINFAYRAFKWRNGAAHNAAVHCVIVGFSRGNPRKKFIYDENNTRIQCQNINAYLMDADDVFVEKANTPLCAVPEIGIGNKPIDGGYYLFSADEKDKFLEKEPAAAKFFRKWIGGDEFINCFQRYCLWLGEASGEELDALPLCRERIEKVRAYRLQSSSEGTRKLAEYPTRFHVENMPSEPYIVIPEVSSERRQYIPIGFIFDNNTICSNQLRLISGVSLYNFGILTSKMHMAWMRAVSSRLDMRYRYSNKLVYNTFPWPDATEAQKKTVSDHAQIVLDIRDDHPDMSLGKMYNPETMPDDLREAHQKLDLIVDKLYNPKGFASDEDRLQALFVKYAALVKAGETSNA